jgi:hypothetical protein
VVPQVQLPPEHCEPVGHLLPHAPQLALSLNMVSGPGHVQYDEPPDVTHSSPLGHTLPHLPQLVGSFSVPWEHWHVPLLQTWLLVHALPHLPQSLLVWFTCRPSFGQTQ